MYKNNKHHALGERRIGNDVRHLFAKDQTRKHTARRINKKFRLTIYLCILGIIIIGAGSIHLVHSGFAEQQDYINAGPDAKTLYDTVAEQTRGLDNNHGATVAVSSGAEQQSGMISLPTITLPTVLGDGVYTYAASANDKYPIYYFHGDVNNNNVIFNGFCWKIVRTTEKGGTKLLYNGESTNADTCVDAVTSSPKRVGNYSNTTINSSLYGSDSYNNSFLNLGRYMYNDEIGGYPKNYIAVGTSVRKYCTKTDTTCQNTPPANVYTSFSKEIVYQDGEYYLVDADITQTDGYVIYWNNTYIGRTNVPDSSIEKMQGAYICSDRGNHGSGEKVSCGNKVSYVVSTSTNEFHYLTFEDGHSIQTLLQRADENKKSSPVKESVDKWFSENMANRLSDIEDDIYCNDRRINIDFSQHHIDSRHQNNVFYEAYNRISSTSAPSLECRKVDSFTVNDDTNGNADLTYPIGLLSADEMKLAGDFSYIGPTLKHGGDYEHEQTKILSMTPMSLNLYSSYENWPFHDGVYYYLSNYANSHYPSTRAVTYNGMTVKGKGTKFGLTRPVISLKLNMLIASGDGSAEHPYIISGETKKSDPALVKEIYINDENLYNALKNCTPHDDTRQYKSYELIETCSGFYNATFDDTNKTITVNPDQVTKIVVRNAHIEDISALSNFSNLSILDVSYNDITKLPSLKNLQYLAADHNQIEDISNLSKDNVECYLGNNGYDYFCGFNLSYNSIKDLSPVLLSKDEQYSCYGETQDNTEETQDDPEETQDGDGTNESEATTELWCAVDPEILTTQRMTIVYADNNNITLPPIVKQAYNYLKEHYAAVCDIDDSFSCTETTDDFDINSNIHTYNLVPSDDLSRGSVIDPSRAAYWGFNGQIAEPQNTQQETEEG